MLGVGGTYQSRCHRAEFKGQEVYRYLRIAAEQTWFYSGNHGNELMTCCVWLTADIILFTFDLCWLTLNWMCKVGCQRHCAYSVHLTQTTMNGQQWPCYFLSIPHHAPCKVVSWLQALTSRCIYDNILPGKGWARSHVRSIFDQLV